MIRGWGGAESTLENSFNTRVCSSGNSSTDFPAFPAVGPSILWPVGSTRDNFIEERTYRYYSSPASSAPNECAVENPILPSNGTKIQLEIDYRAPGDLPLEIVRTFTSTFPIGRDLYHWTWTLGNRMRIEQANGYVTAYYADRRYVTFLEQPDGSFVAAGGSTMTLTRDGENLVLANFDRNRREIFDASSRLLEVHRNGRSLFYSYDEVDGLSRTTATDSFGKQVQLVLGTSGQPAYAVDPSGDRIWYQYGSTFTGGGSYTNLEKVVYGDSSDTPPVDSDTPPVDFESRSYHYEYVRSPIQHSPKLLTGITDERGIRYSTYTYKTSGDGSGSWFSNYFYAESSELAGGVNKVTIVPNIRNSTTEITNSLGRKTIYRYSIIDGVRKLVGVDGLASEFCPARASSMTYDDIGFSASRTDWEGNITEYLRSSRGLAESTTFAMGTPEQRVVTTQWHDEFNLPEIVTEPGRETVYSYVPYTNPNYTQRTITDFADGTTRTWN